MDLDAVKLYLRAGDDEDEVIQGFIDATEVYVKSVTGKTKVKVGESEADISTDALWILTVKKIIARWYTHRGDNLPASVAKEDVSIEMLINHISLCGDYT